MNVRQSYDQWAQQYDVNHNKTRDLESVSLRETLAGHSFENILEIGCGTGKNTTWLQDIAEHILAVDLSGEMLAMARKKISSDKIVFVQADIMNAWNFAHDKFDLITFSLVLEHLEDLKPIFQKAYNCLKPGGLIYIGELHPFKQYNGTKARFETEAGTEVVTCFNHHVSDFTKAATETGLSIELLNEYFDNRDNQDIPRILTLLLKSS